MLYPIYKVMYPKTERFIYNGIHNVTLWIQNIKRKEKKVLLGGREDGKPNYCFDIVICLLYDYSCLGLLVVHQ